MIVEPLKEHHFSVIELQESQLLFNQLIAQDDYRRELLKHEGYSLYDDKNLNCIAMAGVIDAGFGRGVAWSLLSKYAAQHMVTITKEVFRFLGGSGFKRIEMTVDASFEEGLRWAVMLGFRCECKMNKYCDGKSHYLFARYK